MPAEVSRRDFLRGAEAIVLATVLNRAYAGVSPEDLAGDENFWKKIRSAYLRDPKILNLNNGGVAPAPTIVLDAEIEAIRYSNQLPSYRMWNDLEPRVEDVRKKLARMWNTDPEGIAITRNASESLQIAVANKLARIAWAVPNHFVAGRPQFELMRPLSESFGIVLNPQQHRAGAVNEQAA